MEEDRVAKEQTCPSCGEDRKDYLVWDEDGDSVHCASCGSNYSPGILIELEQKGS